MYDRYLVRVEEMRQSIRILEQALDRLPDGPINVADPRVTLPDKSAAMGEMEAMIFHFKQVMEGVKANRVYLEKVADTVNQIEQLKKEVVI